MSGQFEGRAQDGQPYRAQDGQQRQAQEMDVDFQVVDVAKWDDELRAQYPNDLCTQAIKRLTVTKQAERASAAMQDVFDQADADHDGFITVPEINTLLNTGNLSNRQRQALLYMKTNFDMLENSSNDEWGPENDGVTKADIEEFANQARGAEKVLTDYAGHNCA